MFYLEVFNTLLLGCLFYAMTRVWRAPRESEEISLTPEEDALASADEKKRCVLCGVSEVLTGPLKPAFGDKRICWACRQEIVEQEGFAGEISPGIKPAPTPAVE